MYNTFEYFVSPYPFEYREILKIMFLQQLNHNSILNAYHCHWLHGNTYFKTIYENILLGSYAVYKYINKEILSGTVKRYSKIYTVY